MSVTMTFSLIVNDLFGLLCGMVRYEAVNAILLNEFLKDNRKAEKFESDPSKDQHG